MRKWSILLLVLIAGIISGCGGSSSGTAPTINYGLPTAAVLPTSATMGGTVQKKALVMNAAIEPFAGAITGPLGTAGLLDGTGAVARFSHPTDITTDGKNFYVADYLNNAIRQIDATGVVQILTCTDIATGLPIAFNHPTGITTDGVNIYVADSGSNTIRMIDITTKKVTIIGSTTGVAGSIDSPVITDVRFNQPIGITTDNINVYVTDAGNNTIRWFDIATRNVHTLAGTAGSAGAADGTQTNARFNSPARLTTDGTSLYVTDFLNRTIRKVDIATGTVTTIAGNASVGPGRVDATGIGTVAIFNQPNGITTDGSNLYVTDSYNNTIYSIDKATLVVTKIAGSTGVNGFSNTLLDTPTGLTTDGTALYVADSVNNTLRMIK